MLPQRLRIRRASGRMREDTAPGGQTVQRLSIIRWQQTQGKYVGILQAPDRFRPDSIRAREISGGATVLEGELLGTVQKDWYCISFPKEDMEFDEARERAMALLETENRLRAAGKPSLTAG